MRFNTGESGLKTVVVEEDDVLRVINSLRASTFVLLSLLFISRLALGGPLEDAQAEYDAKHYDVAAKAFRLLAEKGNPIAQLRLGQMYVVGIGLPRDPALGVTWLQRSAEQGNIQAMDWLGDSYRFGVGVSRDWGVAARWYEGAAEQGEPLAMQALGSLYMRGQGVSRDLVLAFKWLDLATHAPRSSGIANLAALDRDQVAEQMTEEQLEEAKRMVARWHPR